MTISEPKPSHMPQLRGLWKAAFGDTDDFLDMFYTRAYAPQRCRCVLDGDRLAAVLYWFDCSFGSEKLAYIYAVATDPAYRNRGMCRLLMEDAHAHLKALGYTGALLLPQEPGLRQMYGKMGYRPCTRVSSVTCQAAGEPAVLTRLTPEDFAALRKTMLPPGSVIQEGENLSFLSGFAEFYRGSDFLLTAFRDGETLIGCELLGNVTNAPAIVQAFGLKSGSFRYPGNDLDFAMCTSFTSNFPELSYFGFVFD